MRTVDVETSLGKIPITGLPGAFSGSKPGVLVITGAFAHPSEMSNAPHAFAPEFDAVVARLPGNGTPRLSETSVAAFARAFDEVVHALWPGRVVVPYGVSVGGLVTLAMKAPEVRRIIAVDPPIWTHKLWPLVEGLREPFWPEHRDFLANVFGMRDVGGVGVCYRPLIDRLTVPTTVVVAEEPLYPVRALARLPSMVDEEDRAYMAANPLVTLHVAPNCGHNIPHQAGRFLHDIALDVCASAEAVEAHRAGV